MSFAALANTLLRNNRLVRERRMSFKEIKELYIDEAHRIANKNKGKLKIVLADPRVLRSLRKKLKRERRQELILRWIILLLTITFGIFIIHLVLKYAF
jgi:hypothetical protein